VQIDFHHTVTYALARLGGFPHQDARIIAHAAQYVDDATFEGKVTFDGREPYERIASAHPIDPFTAENWEDVRDNANNPSNLQTWSIFHFLPGNGGATAGNGQEHAMVERFVCQPDSPVAAAMWEACKADSGKVNHLHRLGITAHVYVDTWAHHGFVGMVHRRNLVYEISEPGFSMDELKNRLGSKIFLALPLGHGMALSLPDMPFLDWSYQTWDGGRMDRPNTRDFVQASCRLVENFGYYRGVQSGIQEKDLAVLRDALTSIRLMDGDMRHQEWLRLLQQPSFSFGALAPKEIQDLTYVPKGPGSWKCEALGTPRTDDVQGPFTYSPAFETSHWKYFHDALKEHRKVMLEGIFPRFGLNPLQALL